MSQEGHLPPAGKGLPTGNVTPFSDMNPSGSGTVTLCHKPKLRARLQIIETQGYGPSPNIRRKKSARSMTSTLGRSKTS
jgi:hypothetical protein